MNEVTALFLRRMKAPLILIVIVYSIAIVGLILIPGVDNDGNVWHMSIFHAFYLVSYTATTIGFGEIPYPLTDTQRIWTLVIIYMTVISWFYALGTVISLFQDKSFIHERNKLKFKRNIRNINRPFYLVCGFGETGRAVVNALLKEHYGAVVIEIEEDVTERHLDNNLEFVPSLTADATIPEVLEHAGVHLHKCRGVIAVTAADETNLKIAIASKLLHPDITVICRSDNKEHEDNMLSFGTDHIINPYESFANVFSMTLHSPSMQLIHDWLTGAPNTSLSSPVHIDDGHWILCGYGRFGEQLHKELVSQDIRTVVIDHRKETKAIFISNKNPDDAYLIGTGIDEETLTLAGIDKAAGVIAGSDNDSNNLSIIMTARQLNDQIFVVGRQNSQANKLLYSKINDHYNKAKGNDSDELINVAHLDMQPSEIIARKIRAILIAPLLNDFVQLAALEDQDWANLMISRLSAVIGEERPYIWTVTINKDNSPGIAQALGHGRRIEIKHIIQNPSNPDKNLSCIALLLKRGDNLELLPDTETELQAFDQILFCGLVQAKDSMKPVLTDYSLLNYVMTAKSEPRSFIWKKLIHRFQKPERRDKSR